MLLIVEVPDASVTAVIKALESFGVSAPKLFAQMPLPERIPEILDDEMAKKIAVAVAPTSNQSMRKEALKVVLNGHDTFSNQQGESDPALRNAVGALSKALRPFSPHSPPLDLLCSRIKKYFDDGECKGMYQGTRYVPTKLGIRVRGILEGMGTI